MKKLDDLKRQYEKLGKEIEKLEKQEGKLKLYDVIEWCGYEWYIINLKDDETTLFMKDKMPVSRVEKYFSERLLDSDKDVKFDTKGKNPWWADSEIRFILNSIFLNDLDVKQMNKMVTTVKLDDQERTTEDYVRLITKEEAESLPQEILKCSGEYGYWTMSPSYFDYWGIASEFYVTSTGVLAVNYVSNGYGVRPVINLNTDVNELIKLKK